jgi:uncharacterized protein with NAD-binding domain and iron-sulfur cluster
MTKRVAILGGGMAGLAAAFRLTRPGGPDVEVTLYQRGGRLGGKGASSRGEHGRIEEHGLHVWLGHYDNAFRLLRSAYAEVDRATTDPKCPIQDWRQAFEPANVIGLGDWMAVFPDDGRLPGDPDADGTMTVASMVQRMIELLGRVGQSMHAMKPAPRAVLSTRRRPPPPRHRTAGTISGLLNGVLGAAADPVAARRAAQFVDLLGALIRGIFSDDLFRRGFNAVDDEDLIEWLVRHGASADTVDGPFVRGMYDLAFAYEDGDPSRPRFPAGLGIHLAGRSFVDYKGALFWKMRAGMGDVVIAPLYEVLKRRGVRFEFFHRLDAVHLDATASAVSGVTLGRQLDLAAGVSEYDPLARVGGLPVFPDAIDIDQVRAGPDVLNHDLESHWCQWPDAGCTRLEADRDFDALVLAVPVGMIPYTCGELLAADSRWQSMVENMRTVATHAFQLWLNPDERSLGWNGPSASVTGVGHPFDTFASMSQTVQFEAWPAGDAPSTAASFCAAMPEAVIPAMDDPDHPAKARAAVRDAAVRFLDERAQDLWPSFGWEALRAPSSLSGPDRFTAQHWRANTDPSDRYVQASPGDWRYRLRPDGSGFRNLVLAGDWTDNGVNAGCIESAVASGLEAANAVEGRPINDGISAYRPLGPAPEKVFS